MTDLNFWHHKRVLVGGGCGFLGSYLVPELLRARALVTVADNLENGYVENLQTVRDHVRFVLGDLRDRSFCDQVMPGHEIVLNFAAKAYGLEYSSSHNGDMLVSNLLCTLVPLESGHKHGVERFLIVSSSCVYPDDAPVPTPELPVFTGMPEKVNEGYGWAKRIQELAGTYYAREYGMKVSVVRPFNPYGANYRWKSGDKSHVVPALVKRVMDGENPLQVWGSGRQRRNLMHASDAIKLILKVVEKDLGPVPVNIGWDDDVSISELVQLICEISGVHPVIEFDTSKPEGRFRKCADATRLRQIVPGFQPEVSLRAGIAEMIEWYNQTFAHSVTQAFSSVL